MARSEPTIEQVLTVLAGTPPRLAELTAGMTPAELQTRPTPDEWSANDVLAHLRACADMWGSSITTLLREDHPTIRAVNPKKWIRDTDYPERAFRMAIHERPHLQQVARLAGAIRT